MTPTSAIRLASQSSRDSAPSSTASHPESPESFDRPGGPSAATFTFPTRILFGPGTRTLLASELNRLGVARPMIVTDPGLLATGLVEQVIAPLGRQAVVYSEVKANPAEEDILAGLTSYREADCDGLVGVGGGSPIDAAKAIRLLVTHPGRLADYDLTRGGQDRIPAGHAAHGGDANHGRHGK